VLPYYRPDIGPEYDQGEFSARKVLLVRDVLIGGNHHVEPGLFRHRQEFAVFQLVGPLHFGETMDFMVRQEAAHANRNIFIKQDAQSGDSGRTSKSFRLVPAGFQTVLRFRRR